MENKSFIIILIAILSFDSMAVNCEKVTANDIRKSVNIISNRFAAYTEMYPYHSYYIREYNNVMSSLDEIDGNTLIELPEHCYKYFIVQSSDPNMKVNLESLPSLVVGLRKLSGHISAATPNERPRNAENSAMIPQNSIIDSQNF